MTNSKATETSNSRYVGKHNQYGQIDIIRRDNEHKPHVYVRYWDGGMYCQACIPADEEPGYRANADMRSVTPAVWTS